MLLEKSGGITKGSQSWISIGRTDAKAEIPMLWPPVAKNRLIRKDPSAGKDWGQEKTGMSEDETVGWHHWLNGHEFEQALGDGEGQVSLACSSQWGHRVGHDWATEQQHSPLILHNCCNRFFLPKDHPQHTREWTLTLRSQKQGFNFLSPMFYF